MNDSNSSQEIKKLSSTAMAGNLTICNFYPLKQRKEPVTAFTIGTKRNPGEHLTQEQIAEVQEAFSLFDKDGDGCISTRELGPVLRSCGLNPAEVEISGLVEEFDIDGSGVVEFSDVLTMLNKVEKSGDTESDLDEAFRVFDKEGNGQIAAAELRHIMTNMGEKLTDEQVEEMMGYADADAQGEINYKDFIKLITGK